VPRLPRAGVLFLAALLVVPAACSGDDGAKSASVSSSTTRRTTTTRRATTTTTTEVCTAPAVAADATGQVSQPIDTDGDGTDDTVSAYTVGDAAHIRVDTATHGAIDAAIETDGPLTPTIVGGVDIGGGPGLEVFTTVGSGASVDLVGVFTQQGCDLVRLLGPDGVPTTFPIGGSVTHGGGLACEGDRLVELTATSDDGETYQATRLPLTLEGRKLVAGTPEKTELHRGTDDAEIPGYYTLSCPGLSLG
jgi:hypothetical protein